MHRKCDVTWPSNNKRNYASVQFLSNRIRPRSYQSVVQRNHILHASSSLFSWFERSIKRERRHKRICWCIYLEPLFSSFCGAQCLLKENIKETLAVTLALTENSNVAQTLGAHLRRKRAAVTSSWMGDERVNQSLVAFSRRCMPRYTPIRETGRERGFYLIGGKFPLLGNLLFTQDHLNEAILPHNSIIANPVSYFIANLKRKVLMVN